MLEKGVKTAIHLGPIHVEIKGNERTDRQANET